MNSMETAIELIAKTQADMASSMAAMSNSLVNLEVSHSRSEERIISLLEKNDRLDERVSGHSSRIRSLENLTSVNKFARQFAPRMFFALISACGVGGSLVYVTLEVINK